MKTAGCKCIPDIIPAPEYITTESYKNYETNLYKVMHDDFIDHTVYFHGKKVLLDFYKIQDGKSDTFFHVLCGDKKEYPNLRRAERIKYARSFIENYLDCDNCQSDCKIKMFVKYKNGRKRYHFFSPDYLYMVVLEDEGKVMKLVTAFYIDQKYMLHNYNKDYENYVNSIKE